MDQTKGELTVTRHAMVRYLERKHRRKVKRLCSDVRRDGDLAIIAALSEKHGLVVADLISEMLAPPVVAAYRAGAKAVKHDGVRFVFGDRAVVTVTPTVTRKFTRSRRY